MDGKSAQDLGAKLRTVKVDQRFAAMSVEIVSTKWMVLTSTYSMAIWKASWANSKAERSGVAKVKWPSALGSTAQKTLAVPRRSYFVIPISYLRSPTG